MHNTINKFIRDVIPHRATKAICALMTVLSLSSASFGKGYATESNPKHTTEYKETGNTYRPIELDSIRPVDILPIIGKIEVGDKRCYEHIEHLRLAEATRIVDMMRKYGAGKHSPEEYKELMLRLNPGMLDESPKGYNNYEVIGGQGYNQPSNHAHNSWYILTTLVNHANFKVKYPGIRYDEELYNLCTNNEKNIYIFGLSTSFESDKNGYLTQDINQIKKILRMGNFMLFCAATNICEGDDGILKNKILQEDVNTIDNHSIYGSASSANGKNDNNIDRHLLVTAGMPPTGVMDQTYEDVSSSKFPVGFHDKVTFSGHPFPYLSGSSNKITGEAGKPQTSYTNYTNVAMACLCFQMFAEVKDVDELLEMIRSTARTDYIKFDLNGDGDTDDIHNGQPESQPLILINPAGFFQKYLMPTSLPPVIRTDEIVDLEKGYYHGVVCEIPGAEVNINGQWIEFSNENKEIILAQNPMTLKWRLNGRLLADKYKYNPGDIIKGQILVVDDMWNVLNISKDISINIENANGINNTKINTPNTTHRYTIDGRPLKEKPTKPGIYIHDGKKIYITSSLDVLFPRNKEHSQTMLANVMLANTIPTNNISRDKTRNTNSRNRSKVKID